MNNTQLNDNEKLILTSFWAALYKQSTPLPQDVQAKLSTIVQSSGSYIHELHDLAKNTPNLQLFYQETRQFLVSLAAQRSKGFPPATQDDPNDRPRTSNSIRDLSELTEKITSSLNQSSTVLGSSDPVHAVQQILQPSAPQS
jgi:hypothetical protein